MGYIQLLHIFNVFNTGCLMSDGDFTASIYKVNIQHLYSNMLIFKAESVSEIPSFTHKVTLTYLLNCTSMELKL